MIRLAADENLNRDIVRGILRRNPRVDIVRVQDAGLSGANDPTVLEWAAQQRRVLVTHDVSTITRSASVISARMRGATGASAAMWTWL